VLPAPKRLPEQGDWPVKNVGWLGAAKLSTVSRQRLNKNIFCLGKRCSNLRLGNTNVSVAYSSVRIHVLAEVGGSDCLGYLRLD
jgi:hypothetical protein